MASKSAIGISHAVFAAANKVGFALEEVAEAVQAVVYATSTLHREVFVALTRAGATLPCATKAAQRALSNVTSFYHAVFVAAIKAKASPVIVAEAAPEIFREIAEFYCIVFDAASKTKTSPTDAATTALNVLNNVVRFYCDVFTAANKADLVKRFALDIALNSFTIATKLYRSVFAFQVEADLDAFNATIKFYRGTFIAAFTKVNVTMDDVSDLEKFVGSSISNIYCPVFAAVIETKASTADAANIALGVLSAASKFRHFIAAAIPAEVAPMDAAMIILNALKTVTSVYDAVFASIKYSVALTDAADVALSAFDTAGNLYRTVFAATKVDTTSVCASAIAQHVLNTIASMYRYHFGLTICAGFMPGDAARAALAVFDTAAKFCHDGFVAVIQTKIVLEDASEAILQALCKVDQIYIRVFTAIRANIAPEDAIKAALNLFNAAGEFHHFVFAAAPDAEAAPTHAPNAAFVVSQDIFVDASCAALRAFNTLADIYHRVFAAAIEVKVAPTDATRAALDVFNVVAGICRDVLVATPKTNVASDGVSDDALLAPKALADFYFAVINAIKNKVAPADAIRVALDALNVAGGFYRDVFAAIKVNVAPNKASHDAVAVLARMINVYLSVSTAICAETVSVDTNGAVLGILTAAGKFYNGVFAAIITINPTPTCARNAALSAFGQIDEICRDVTNVPVGAQITPLVVAETICAAINAFGAVYSGILRGIDTAAAGTRTSAGVEAASSDTCDAIFSSERSAHTVYQITFNDVCAAARFASIDVEPALFAAENAAVTVLDVYRSEFKRAHVCFDSASTGAENATDLALTAAATVCGTYRKCLASACRADATAASALAAQIDAFKRFEKAL